MAASAPAGLTELSEEVAKARELLKPSEGAPQDIADYEQLLRITYDNTADFGWGTNWIYLLAPREDLAGGDLSRIVVTGANS